MRIKKVTIFGYEKDSRCFFKKAGSFDSTERTVLFAEKRPIFLVKIGLPFFLKKVSALMRISQAF